MKLLYEVYEINNGFLIKENNEFKYVKELPCFLEDKKKMLLHEALNCFVLDISVRCRNSLVNMFGSPGEIHEGNEIIYVSDLLKLSRKFFFNQLGFGRKSFNELNNELFRLFGERIKR